MLQSQILFPSEALRPFVHHYWVMQADNHTMELNIMPTGCTKWMFHRGLPFSVEGQIDSSNTASICGQYTTAAHVGMHGHADLLFVFFQPYAMKMITGIPACLFNEANVNMDDLEMPGFKELKRMVLEAPTNELAIRHVERFIIRQLAFRNDSIYLKPFLALMESVEHGLDLSVPALADVACMSERQLRRVFAEYVGLSPKQMLCIRRCFAASRAIQQMEQGDFTPIIYQLGFTDHSHLYKEFKLYAGMSPSDYLIHLQQIRNEHLMAGYRAYHG